LKRANNFFKTAYSYKKANRFAESIIQYRTCIGKNPRHTKALYNLALLLIKRGDGIDEAEALLRQAIEVDPTFVDAYFNLGNLLEEQKFDLDGAEAMYRKALQEDSTFWPAMFNLATLISGGHKKAYKEADNWFVTLKAIAI